MKPTKRMLFTSRKKYVPHLAMFSHGVHFLDSEKIKSIGVIDASPTTPDTSDFHKHYLPLLTIWLLMHGCIQV